MSANEKPTTPQPAKAAKDDARSRGNERAPDKPDAPELEPLDEESLERVMRDAPL